MGTRWGDVVHLISVDMQFELCITMFIDNIMLIYLDYLVIKLSRILNLDY